MSFPFTVKHIPFFRLRRFLFTVTGTCRSIPVIMVAMTWQHACSREEDWHHIIPPPLSCMVLNEKVQGRMSRIPKRTRDVRSVPFSPRHAAANTAKRPCRTVPQRWCAVDDTVTTNFFYNVSATIRSRQRTHEMLTRRAIGKDSFAMHPRQYIRYQETLRHPSHRLYPSDTHTDSSSSDARILSRVQVRCRTQAHLDPRSQLAIVVRSQLSSPMSAHLSK